jgi:hypothetical protein
MRNAAPTSRRRFLGTLAALPAVAAPALVLAQAMPVEAATAAPEASALDRARHHYAELTKALDEIALNANAWVIMGAHRKPHPCLAGAVGHNPDA